MRHEAPLLVRFKSKVLFTCMLTCLGEGAHSATWGSHFRFAAWPAVWGRASLPLASLPGPKGKISKGVCCAYTSLYFLEFVIEVTQAEPSQPTQENEEFRVRGIWSRREV